jgi:hypothetical protein
MPKKVAQRRGIAGTQEAIERRMAAIMGLGPAVQDTGDADVSNSDVESNTESAANSHHEEGDEVASRTTGPLSTASALRKRGFLSHIKGKNTPVVREVKVGGKQRGAIEVVDQKKNVQDVLPSNAPVQKKLEEEEQLQSRSKEELQGLKILRAAVKNQSHNRPLAHHERQDYEFRLRRVATQGVVRLFNALAASQRAAQQAIEAETAEGKEPDEDNNLEEKAKASRETFLSTLRGVNNNQRPRTAGGWN